MKRKGKVQEYNYEYRRNKLLELFELRGGKCEHCDLRDLKHIEIYDYHHTDPSQKEFNVGGYVLKPMEQVLKEAKKCLLLCANCHRIEHHRLSRVARDKETKRLKKENTQMVLNLTSE